MTEIKKEVDTIQNTSVVNMAISGYFYSRLVKVTQNLLKSKSTEEQRVALESIEKSSITDEFAFDLETMLILCKDFEKTAKAANLLEKKPLEEVMSEN